MSCDPYSNVKSRQDDLFHSAPFSLVPAQTIFSYATVVGGYVRSKCPFNIKDMSILEERSKTDFLESQEGKIRLRRRRKYYTRVIYSIGKQSLLTLLSSSTHTFREFC